MVMRPDPRTGALTTVRRRQLGPWWLWTIVVILAASTAYAGYWIRGTQKELTSFESARQILAGNIEQLKTDRLELQSKLDEAGETEAKARAEVRAATALAEELRKREAALQSELKEARKEAEASKKEAARLGQQVGRAEAAFAQVRKLQDRVAALRSDLEAAQAEAAAAAASKSELEREIADLKKALGEMQQKSEAVTTGTTQGNP